MTFNVATLLQEPVGSRRRARLDGEPLAAPAEGWRGEVSGTVELLRTVRGVLVRARLRSAAALECARCLEPFEAALELDIAEEFVPAADPLTGEPVEAAADELRIDARHVLDLGEAVRQYEQTAIPLRPVCRPGCAGLCPECGRNRNEDRCDCAGGVTDGPFAALAGLGERLRAEESDGGTEA